MSYFNRYLLGGFVQSGQNCTTSSDIFGDGSDLALYRFQGNAVDDSGNSFNGTPTDVGFTLTNGAQPSSGARFGGSAAFNGTSSTIQTSATLFPTNGDFTFSSWVYFNDISATQYIWLARGYNQTGGLNFGLGFSTYDTGRILIFRGTGTATSSFVQTAQNAVNQNQWHHILFTFNSTSGATEIFIDGVSAITGTLPTGAINFNGNDSGAYFFGFRAANALSPNYFNGFLDQVRIFNRTVNATGAVTIFEDYKCQPGSTSAFSQCTTDTVGYPVNAAGAAGDANTIAFYKLDDAAGSATAADSTSAANNGTATNVVFGDQGIYGSCALFNGSNSTISTTIPTNSVEAYSVWFYFESGTTIGRVLGATVGTGGGDIALEIQTNGTLSTRIQNLRELTATGALGSTGWKHVYYDTNRNLYINGVLITTTSFTESFPSANVLIGALRNNFSFFNSKIDQLRLYDTTLSAAQVTQLYHEVYCDTGCTTSTVDYQTTAGALYRLDGDGNDSSTNAYTGTVGSSVTFVQGKYDLASNHTGGAGAANIIDTGYSPDVTSAITYSWWAKFNATGQNNFTIVDQTSPAGAFPGLGLYFIGGNVTIVIDGSAAGGNAGFTQDLLWHHYALRHDGAGNCTFYFDGSLLVTDGRGTSPSNTTQNIVIGGNNGVWGNWNGQVDQLRVYPAFLTPGQITNLANEVSCS